MGCISIFRIYRVNEMSMGSCIDDASSKFILSGVQKNKMYSIIEWSM